MLATRRLVTDSLACARLAAEAAAGEHGDDGEPGMVDDSCPATAPQSARCDWISERLCTLTRGDPMPASTQGAQRTGGGRLIHVQHEELVGGGGEVVLEEEVLKVHIYRQLCCDPRSVFGRMWKRRQGHNFLLQLRKSGGKIRAHSLSVPTNAAFYL